jgi:3-deoxy-D-manno-octulosonate 8-phosphate phosphatase KdsC-like HAD superfamily phosphatase
LCRHLIGVVHAVAIEEFTLKDVDARRVERTSEQQAAVLTERLVRCLPTRFRQLALRALALGNRDDPAHFEA